jgi:hypothetical protein
VSFQQWLARTKQFSGEQKFDRAGEVDYVSGFSAAEFACLFLRLRQRLVGDRHVCTGFRVRILW